MIALKKQAKLLLIISASMLILLPPTVRADAPKPILSVGDMWRYNISSAPGPSGTSSGGSFGGSLTQIVQGTETVTVGGQSYESYKIGLSGAGIFTITTGALAGTSDSFTLTGASYRRVSDLADARDSINVVISAGYFSVTVSAEAVSSPPLQYYDFPLSTGKSWTSTSTVDITATAPNFGGIGTSTTTNSSTVSAKFNVESTERVTVQAGAFQTYKIKQDVIQTYASGHNTTLSQESYYSPMAGNTVKGTIPVGGSPFFNLELVDYTAHPFNSLVNISNGGKSYSIGLNTNVEATGTTSNSTAITFNVEGFGTGKANVRIPAALNNTAITVYEDTGIITSTSTKNGTEYDTQFNFALSQHKISIIYGKPPSGLAFVIGLLTNPIVIIAYIIVAISIATVAAVRDHRRRRPSAPLAEPTETGPGANGSPSPPVPPPSTNN